MPTIHIVHWSGSDMHRRRNGRDRKTCRREKIVIENNWIERKNIKNKCKHPSCCSLYSSPLNVTSLNDGSIFDQQCGVAYERASEGGRDIY